MPRYPGGDWPEAPKVAVICNDALGNYVAITPLLRLLEQERSPCTIHLYSGNRIAEFIPSAPCVDAFIPLFGPDWRSAFDQPRDYDLVINVERSPAAQTLAALLTHEVGIVMGPTAGAEGREQLPFEETPQGRLWEDRHWASPDLPQRFSFLKTGHISEVFCRACYLTGPIPPYELGTEPVPWEGDAPIVMAVAASLPEKIWSASSWSAIANELRDAGRRVVLVGAKPKVGVSYWLGSDVEEALVSAGVEDHRGRYPLAEVAGRLATARAVITLDNGIMHMAAAAQVPTIALFRPGIHHLWLPRIESIQPVIAPEDGTVADISVASVKLALDKFHLLEN